MKYAIISVLAVGILIIVTSMLKSGRFFKSLISSVFQGISALLCVNLFGLITGIHIAVNWYTLGTVSVFGIPGCISLLVLNIILK